MAINFTLLSLFGSYNRFSVNCHQLWRTRYVREYYTRKLYIRKNHSLKLYIRENTTRLLTNIPNIGSVPQLAVLAGYLRGLTPKVSYI